MFLFALAAHLSARECLCFPKTPQAIFDKQNKTNKKKKQSGNKDANNTKSLLKIQNRKKNHQLTTPSQAVTHER